MNSQMDRLLMETKFEKKNTEKYVKSIASDLYKFLSFAKFAKFLLLIVKSINVHIADKHT